MNVGDKCGGRGGRGRGVGAPAGINWVMSPQVLNGQERAWALARCYRKPESSESFKRNGSGGHGLFSGWSSVLSLKCVYYRAPAKSFISSNHDTPDNLFFSAAILAHYIWGLMKCIYLLQSLFYFCFNAFIYWTSFFHPERVREPSSSLSLFFFSLHRFETSCGLCTYFPLTSRWQKRLTWRREVVRKLLGSVFLDKVFIFSSQTLLISLAAASTCL